MSLVNDGSNMVMPVGPMYGNGGNSFGWGGDGSFWIIILFLFAMFGKGYGLRHCLHFRRAKIPGGKI